VTLRRERHLPYYHLRFILPSALISRRICFSYVFRGGRAGEIGRVDAIPRWPLYFEAQKPCLLFTACRFFCLVPTVAFRGAGGAWRRALWRWYSPTLFAGLSVASPLFLVAGRQRVLLHAAGRTGTFFLLAWISGVPVLFYLRRASVPLR